MSTCLPSSRSPTSERSPLFQPAGSPSLSSHDIYILEDNSSQLRNLRGSSGTSSSKDHCGTLLLDDPPSYTRDVSEDQTYLSIVERGEIVKSVREMDAEAIERMKEKDTRLKRNIRRFRFVVRCAHLACRCDSLVIAPLTGSVVVISLLSANFAGMNSV